VRRKDGDPPSGHGDPDATTSSTRRSSQKDFDFLKNNSIDLSELSFILFSYSWKFELLYMWVLNVPKLMNS
jgi:hypothetical protein